MKSATWIAVLVAALLWSPSAGAASAELCWTPPTQNTDGSPLTDLAGYRIFAGCNASGTYELQPNHIDDPSATCHVYEGLPYDTTCYFVGTALNTSGVESAYSNEAVKTLPPLAGEPPGKPVIDVTWPGVGEPPPDPVGGPVMGKPSFIQEVETTWTPTTAATKVTASFDVLAGDILVAFGVGEDTTATGAIVPSGGSLTWTNQETVAELNNSPVTIYTAVVDSDKSMTVTFTRPNRVGISQSFGGNVQIWRGASGIGASNSTNASGAPSLSLTTTEANSAIAVVVGDWNATDGSSRTWRSVNGAAATELAYYRDASAYTLFGGYHADAGAAAAKTVGLSAPGGQAYSIAAVEILASPAISIDFGDRTREDGSGTTVVVSGLDTTGYDYVVAGIKYEGAATTAVMSDSQSNVWTNQPQYGSDSTDYPAVLMAVAPLDTKNAAHSFTVTLGAARSFKELAIWLVDSNGAGVAVEDEVGDAANNVFVSPKDAGDLVTAGESVSAAFVAGYVGGLTWTPGAGWTEDSDTDNDLKMSRHDFDGGTLAVEATPSGNTAFAGAAVSLRIVPTFSYVGGGTTGGSGTTASHEHELDIQEGDLVVGYVNSNSTTAVSGANGALAQNNPVNEQPTDPIETGRSAMFWGIAGPSEPATYSATVGSENWRMIVLVFRPSSGTPIVDAAATTGRQVFPTSTHLNISAINGAVISDHALSIIFGGKDNRTGGSELYTVAGNGFVGVVGNTVTQGTAGAHRIYTTGETVSADVAIETADGSDNMSDTTYSVHISFVIDEGGAVANDLAASLNLTATTAADLVATGQLAAGLDLTVSTVNALRAAGQLGTTLPINLLLAGDVAAPASVAAALQLTATIASGLSATGELDAALSMELTAAFAFIAQGDVEAAMAVLASVAAGLDAAGELDAALPVELTLIAALPSSGDVAASLPLQLSLLSALRATGELDAAASVSLSLASELLATGDVQVAALLTTAVAASLQAADQQDLAANLALAVENQAGLTGLGALEGALALTVSLLTNVQTPGLLAAELPLTLNLLAAASGQAGLDAPLILTADLASELRARGELSTAALLEVALAAPLNAQAGLLANLVLVLDASGILTDGAGEQVPNSVQVLLAALSNTLQALEVDDPNSSQNI